MYLHSKNLKFTQTWNGSIRLNNPILVGGIGQFMGLLVFPWRLNIRDLIIPEKILTQILFDLCLKIVDLTQYRYWRYYLWRNWRQPHAQRAPVINCIIQAIGLDKPGVVLRWFGCRIGTCSRSSPVRPVFSHSPWDWWTHTCGIWYLRLCDNSVDIHLAFLLLADRDGRISFAISEIKNGGYCTQRKLDSRSTIL